MPSDVLLGEVIFIASWKRKRNEESWWVDYCCRKPRLPLCPFVSAASETLVRVRSLYHSTRKLHDHGLHMIRKSILVKHRTGDSHVLRHVYYTGET